MADSNTSLSIPERLNVLETTSNAIVLERIAEVRCAINALLSGRHLCMIGPPGIAKSFLTRTLVSLIGDIQDGEYFEWFVTKFSTPEELVGPHSLKALENDRYVRNTDRKLPVAKLAFLDEIFKASSALLNTLLPILNERIFYNGEPDSSIPLSTLICASNETPESATELAALWDRLFFRVNTKRLVNPSNFDGMLRASVQRYAVKNMTQPVISWADITTAQLEVRKVEIPDDVYDAMADLWGSLSKEKIEPSDRRFVECLPVIQAEAYRAGRMTADINDMRLIAHGLWDQQKDQAIVQRLVFELANPLDKVAMEIRDDVDKLAQEIEKLIQSSASKEDKTHKGVELNSKLEEAAFELAKLRKQLKETGRKSEIMDPLRGTILGLTRRLLKDVFNFDDQPLPA